MLKKISDNSDDLCLFVPDKKVEKHVFLVVTETAPKFDEGLFVLFYRRTADILACRRRSRIKVVE